MIYARKVDHIQAFSCRSSLSPIGSCHSFFLWAYKFARPSFAYKQIMLSSIILYACLSSIVFWLLTLVKLPSLCMRVMVDSLFSLLWIMTDLKNIHYSASLLSYFHYHCHALLFHLNILFMVRAVISLLLSFIWLNLFCAVGFFGIKRTGIRI